MSVSTKAMLPQEIDSLDGLDLRPYVVEKKEDGWWVELHRHGNGDPTELWTRRMKPLDGRGADWLKGLAWPAETVVVGELYVPGGSSPDVTHELANGGERFRFAVFDVLRYLGGDLVPCELSMRIGYREMVVRDVNDERVHWVEWELGTSPKVQAFIERLLAQGEGVIVKELCSPYRPGQRLRDWLKYKCLAGAMPLYVRVGGHVTLTTVDGLWRWKRTGGVLLPGPDGGWRKVTRVERLGVAPTIAITLRSGMIWKVTRNHQIPTERGLLEAGDLRVGDVIQKALLPEEKGTGLGSFDVGWVVGFFIADGSWDRGRAGLRFALGPKDEEAHRRLVEFASTFGGQFRGYRYGNQKMELVTISGAAAAGVVTQYVAGAGAKGKHMSQACWRERNEFIEGLLLGYLAGDGHWDVPNRRWRIGFTWNRALVRDLRVACARIGWTLRIRAKRYMLLGKRRPIASGEIQTEPRPVFRRKDWDKFRVMRILPAKSIVYGVEVDGDHLFVLPDGSVTHNSTFSVDVIITDCESKPSRWRVRPGQKGTDGKVYPEGLETDPWRAGHVGLSYGYWDPARGVPVRVGSLGITGPKDQLEQHVGKVAEVKVWGVYPGGRLRHPQHQRWREDKAPEECLKPEVHRG